MAGENAVQKNNLLEILSGAKDAREKSAFSAEDVALSHDGAMDSALEAREALDAGEGLAAINFEQKATFSAGGGPVVAGDQGGVAIEASGARALAVLSIPIVAIIIAAALAWGAYTAAPDITIDVGRGVACNTPSGQSSILGVFKLLAGC